MGALLNGPHKDRVILVGAVVAVLVLSLVGALVTSGLRSEPVMSVNQVDKVFKPALLGVETDGSVMRVSGLGTGSSNSCDETAFMGILSGGDLAVSLDSDNDDVEGIVVAYTTVKAAQAGAESLDSLIMKCGSDVDRDTSWTKPTTRTYDKTLDKGQVMVVQYGNTVTMLFADEKEVPKDLPDAIQERVDELAG